MIKFKIGMLVSANPNDFGLVFMPGVGEIIAITTAKNNVQVYVCEHNGKYYHYQKHQIYEYVPY